ncbi:uncharacterized protein LOC142769123 [Rhipicephalus microplus]|uniref:uncharacterized protein LOC142769123 n=1 Tax=Rhipicephalus microplus TaxID=6941 RepID=UPI003F6BBA1C
MHVLKLYLIVTPCIFLVFEATTLFASLFQQIGIVFVTLILGWWLSLAINRLCCSKGKPPPPRCDSEHEFMTASQLSRRGYYVLSGSQNMGGEMARGMGHYNVDVVELQTTSESSMNDAFQEITERLFKENAPLHALICNVGSADLGELEWISERGLLHAFDNTVVSTMRLVNRFLPMLREAGGRVVVCAGPSGRIAVPGAGVYSMLNAALISFADCLRREMAKFRVHVVLVEPVWLNYRTPLSRVHSAGIGVKESVSSVSRDVFDDYSLGYVNAFRNLWNHRTTRWYVGQPDVMARSTCLAVSDDPPQYVYPCGYFVERAVNAVLAYMPTQVVDLVQCFFYQPFARLRLGFESNGSADSTSSRRRITSPGSMQRYLHSTLSPSAPMPWQTSPLSTPARELQAMRSDYFPSTDHTAEATPPPATPPPCVRVTGESFIPHRSEGIDLPCVDSAVKAKAWVANSVPPPSPIDLASRLVVIKQLPQQAEPQLLHQSLAPYVSPDESSSSDVTISPELSSNSISRGSLSKSTSPVPPFAQPTSSLPMSPQALTSLQPPAAEKSDVEGASGVEGGTGEASMTQSEDSGSLVLNLMDGTQCEVIASMFASAQRMAQDHVQTPCAHASVIRPLPPQAEALPLGLIPPSPAAPLVAQQWNFRPRGPEPWSPRSPYHIGVRPLPPDAMRVISPPDEGDLVTISPTGEHSGSPIDSATRVEAVWTSVAAGAPGDDASPETPLLPEASAPPLKRMSETYAQYLVRLRKSGQLDAEIEDGSDSFEGGSGPSRDPFQDQGARRRAPSGKSDPDDRH